MRLACLVCLLLLAFGCSESNLDQAVETRLAPIIGGTSDSGHPAVGALVGNALCTGTLISPRLVLTAAHCFNGYEFDTFVLGNHFENPTTSTSIQKCITHPQYTKMEISGTMTPVHDLAVCVLNSPVTGVTPMKLRTASLSDSEGATVTFVGFGATSSSGSGKGPKMKVGVTIDSISSYGFWNLVGSGSVKNTCIGDSGGPGLVINNNVEEVAGVVSAGDYYCVENGWNMRVDLEIGWIKTVAQQNDPGGISFGTCPDGSCGANENQDTCPSDCGEGSSDDMWTPCESAYDCSDDYVCAMFSFGDYCTLECPQPGSKSTCPSDFTCSPVSGGQGVCTPGTGPKCGNGACDIGENGDNCSHDCNAQLWDECPKVNMCGPGLFCIAWTDGTNRCTQDCPAPNSSQGCPAGFICFPLEGESGGACAQDPNAQDLCGNGTCDGGEDYSSCEADCKAGACGSVGPAGCCDGEVRVWCEFGGTMKQGCGSQGCGWDEAQGRYVCGFAGTSDPTGSAPLSCDQLPAATCGNGTCDATESTSLCPQDCVFWPECGNADCEVGETCAACPVDCGECDEDVVTEPDQEGGPDTQDSGGGCSTLANQQVAGETKGRAAFQLTLVALLLFVLAKRQCRQVTRL